jgi:hypothetical protein
MQVARARLRLLDLPQIVSYAPSDLLQLEYALDLHIGSKSIKPFTWVCNVFY